jgi:hypothetical protein
MTTEILNEDDYLAVEEYPEMDKEDEEEDTIDAEDFILDDDENKKEDRVVIRGYYTNGVFWGEFRNAWNQRMPYPLECKTVFCGYSKNHPWIKIEIPFRLSQRRMATVSMQCVRRYGKDMTHVVTVDAEEAEIESFIGKEKSEFSCPFFSVSDERWSEYFQQPFIITPYLFRDS